MNKFFDEFLIKRHPTFSTFQFQVVLIVDSLRRSLGTLKKICFKDTNIYIFPTLQVNITSLLLLSYCGPTTLYHQMLFYFLKKSIFKSAKNIFEESHSAQMK